MKPHRLAPWAIVLVPLYLTCAAIGDAAERAAEQSPQPADGAQPPSVHVLVAYYSLTGNTEKMARGVEEGARRVPGALTTVKKVDEVTKEDLEAADAIVLGSPTYYGNIPGRMKAVIDDCSWKMNVDFTDKVGGAFATGGGATSGKEHVVVSLLLFMISNRMVVAGPLYRNDTTGSIWAELGAAAMTGPLDPGVSDDELDAARRVGQRAAELAKKLQGSGRPAAFAGRNGR